MTSSSRDDSLASAVRQLREASNPREDAHDRILAAVQRSENVVDTPAAERAPLPRPAPMQRPAPRSSTASSPSSMLARRSFARGLVLGLAPFGIGVGVGIGVGFGLWRGSADERSPELAPMALPALAAESPASPRVAAPVELPLATSTVAPRAPAEPQQRASRPKPRARASAAGIERAPNPLGLAEALQLLHRAERAIYSNNAAWAVSLLDDLDERAPAALLHEERVAARILAWCADGQIERAERLASRAREEAPSSIYGDILERPCAPSVAASSGAAPNTRSTKP